MSFINAVISENIFALYKFSKEFSATFRPVSRGGLSSDEII